jgi:tRNA G10  N-methylase Trm11
VRPDNIAATPALGHPTPKIRKSPKKSRDKLFPYYAAFSSAFAQSVLKQLAQQKLKCVFDPWNGSGTVTLAARFLGLRGAGTDVNPAMVIVAKARLCDRVAARRILDGSLKRLQSDEPVPRKVAQTDPLSFWFDEESTSLLRSVMRSLNVPQMSRLESRAGHVSADRAIVVLTAFRTIRKLVSRFRTSNPTWIKRPGNQSELVSVSWKRFCRLFESEGNKVCRNLHPGHLPRRSLVSVRQCESRELDLHSASFDICLTSPPYCTRIDYAIATLPELAVLFPKARPIDELRDLLIGTVVVPPRTYQASPSWGSTCKKMLERVKSHSSKASSSYYFSTLVGYFRGLGRSLQQVRRVLKKKGQLVIVTQGSYYKNIKIDLPKITSEMLTHLGFVKIMATPYRNGNSLLNIHNCAGGRTNRSALPEVVQWFKKIK